MGKPKRQQLQWASRPKLRRIRRQWTMQWYLLVVQQEPEQCLHPKQGRQDLFNRHHPEDLLQRLVHRPAPLRKRRGLRDGASIAQRLVHPERQLHHPERQRGLLLPRQLPAAGH